MFELVRFTKKEIQHIRDAFPEAVVHEVFSPLSVVNGVRHTCSSFRYEGVDVVQQVIDFIKQRNVTKLKIGLYGYLPVTNIVRFAINS